MVHIKVTQTDIDKAINIRQERWKWIPSQQCPISQAARRIFKNKLNGTSQLSIIVRGGGIYGLPEAAQRFVAEFDSENYAKCKPFSFTATKYAE